MMSHNTIRVQFLSRKPVCCIKKINFQNRILLLAENYVPQTGPSGPSLKYKRDVSRGQRAV